MYNYLQPQLLKPIDFTNDDLGGDEGLPFANNSRLVHYHNALRRMLGSSEVRGKTSLEVKEAERMK